MARTTETRTLHFDLSSTPPGVQHTLHLGGRPIALTQHTNETRETHCESQTLLTRIPDQRLTHFVTHDGFLADAIQSYYVTHPPAKGERPNLALAGIVVPKHVARRMHSLHGAVRGPFRAKVRALGLVADSDAAGPDAVDPSWLDTSDLADFQDMTDAATFVVYHHPNLITISAGTAEHESDVAMQIIQWIQRCEAFPTLVKCLESQGVAQNLDGWNQGYSGWANAETFTDFRDSSRPANWSYRYTQATKDAARPAVQQALRAVRNDHTLDGSSFKVDYGSHADQHTTTTATAEAVSDGAVALRMSAAPMDSRDKGYTYSLADPDYHHGRQIIISSSVGSTVTLTVNNSYFRHLGIFLRFLDTAGNPILLTELGEYSLQQSTNTRYDYFKAYLGSRSRILGIPTEDAESVDITFTIPGNARNVMILCGGLGMGANDHEYAGVDVPGDILTGVLDFGLPVFFLALGATADQVIATAGKKAIAAFATWLLDTFARLIAASTIDTGNVSKSDLNTEWTADLLHSVMIEAPKEFLAVLEAAAEVSEATRLAECIPIVGEVLEAIDTVGTLAEITETFADICLSPPVIINTLSILMDVEVTLYPDKKNFEFPETATQMRITVTLEHAQPRVYSAALKDLYQHYPGGVSEISHSFQIPAGGSLTVATYFVDDNGWVAATGTFGPTPAVIPEGQSSLAITIPLIQNPYPVNSETQYVHKRILTSDGKARTWGDGPAPKETVTDLGGNNEVTLNDVMSITLNTNGRLGYTWQGVSPALGEAGTTAGRTPLYTLQSINLNVDAPIEADLRVLGNDSQQYGFTQPIFMEFDPTGPTTSTASAMAMHFIVAPALDPATGSMEYHAFRIDLDGTQPIDLLNAPSYGRFASSKLDAIAVHPRGFVLALNATSEKVEILTIPKQPYASISDAGYATQTGGQGSYVGLLHGSRALAITRDGNTFLVLEEVNQRIQAFSVQGGTSVRYFKGQPWMSLLQEHEGKTIQWCDMSVDPTGYIFVLSYETDGPLYRLDIYQPDGTFLTRTTGVNAARLTVSPFRAVFTANYALLSPSIGQRPEPSVSLWVGSQRSLGSGPES